MSRNRMTEKEKVYFFCLLFPPLWVFLPALILCDAGEAISQCCKSVWRKMLKRG